MTIIGVASMLVVFGGLTVILFWNAFTGPPRMAEVIATIVSSSSPAGSSMVITHEILRPASAAEPKQAGVGSAPVESPLRSESIALSSSGLRFDQVGISKAGGFNLIGAEEFMRIPLGERIQLMINNRVQFLRDGKVVPPTEAFPDQHR